MNENAKLFFPTALLNPKFPFLFKSYFISTSCRLREPPAFSPSLVVRA